MDGGFTWSLSDTASSEPDRTRTTGCPSLVGTDLRVRGPTPQRTLRHTEHTTGLDQRDKVPLVSRSDALRAVVVLYSHPATSVLVVSAYSASITPTTIGCNP